MGATPVGALISTVMPDEMSVHDYGRFWDGVVDGSDAWTCQILGGNIKDGATFTVDSTAFGVVRKQLLMRRRGSSPGDSVFVVGKLGHFWSAALLKISRRSLSSQVMAAAEAALYRPTAKVREGNLLASSGLVSACMDASDGPLGAFFELARVNDLDFLIREIDADPLVRAAADAAATEPLRLLLAWGDWQLVFTAPAAADAALVELARRHRFDLIKVGRAIAGTGRVGVESGGVRRWLNNLSSKRFRNTSYFSHGFPAHVAWYLDAPLYAHELS
jgi:thiamine-monophosphate kinase